MRLFYLVKLLEVVLAVAVLVKILSTSELCTPFVPKDVIEQRIGNETCKSLISGFGKPGDFPTAAGQYNAIVDDENKSKSNLSQFFSDVLGSWDKLWGYEDSHSSSSNETFVSDTANVTDAIVSVTDQSQNIIVSSSERPNIVSSTSLPVENVAENDQSQMESDKQDANNTESEESKPNVEGLKVGFKHCVKTSFSNFFNFGSASNKENKGLRFFGAPIYCVLAYLLITILHAAIQKAKPYECFGKLAIVIGWILWLFVFFLMLVIHYNWEKLWMSAGFFHPEKIDAILFVEVVSLLMGVCIGFEGALNQHLAKKVVLKKHKSACYRLNESI